MIEERQGGVKRQVVRYQAGDNLDHNSLVVFILKGSGVTITQVKP